MRQNVKQANIAEMGIYFLFTFYHNLNIFKVKMFGGNMYFTNSEL